ncbi:MAG: putative baseplate assembly protein [bacterium]|nr:putative baseplate assembly protein [bacterium]
MAAPELDTRSLAAFVATAKSLAQHYVPEWTGVADEQDPGRRVIDLFARLMELLVERENRIPEKSFVKFLELVGVEQFPGSPAEVPVTFLLAKDSAGALVPARSRVATTQTESVDAQVFETMAELFATPARIVEVVDLIPSAGGYVELALGELPPAAEWLADGSRAVTALAPDSGDLQPIPHVLYLAGEGLFGRAEPVDVTLAFALAAGDAEALSAANVTWKRFDGETWIPLDATDVAVGPSQVRVRLNGLEAVAEAAVHGEEGFFLAGHLDAASAAVLTWPTVTEVTGTLQAPGSTPAIAPDFAFANANALDLSKPFRPFGERPRYGDALYLGSREAFGPQVAAVTLEMTILPYTDAQLTAMFAGIDAAHTVDIVTEVEWQYLAEDGSWMPLTKVEHTITPAVGEPALYVGLDRALDNAFTSLFVHLDEATSPATAPLESGDPRVVWEYHAGGGTWRPLDVTDGTADLTTSGTVGFLAPADAAPVTLFRLLLSADQQAADPALYWLRARLASGTYDHPPRLLGIYLNTVMAENRSTAAGDVLVGSGNGKPGQRLDMVHSSILAGELWVREPERQGADELEQLRGDVLETARLEEPGAELEADELVELRESGDGQPEIWVRWHRVPNFLSSGPQSRHYTLDRVRGIVALGDGSNGLVPPIAKDNLVLRGFASGGGEDAHRAATPLAVKELVTSLPFVAKVFNVAQAAGGAAAWSLADTLRFGPQSIKNRGRAVTTEDYEWMIRERFGQVAKVRCLPARAPGGGALVFRPGAVTAIVVPKSSETLPQPSNGLLRAIREYLEAKTLGSIVGEVHVIGPSFTPVSVAAAVRASSPQQASLVARRVASALEHWLHPLTGGNSGEGWPFGRAVYLSEMVAVIARVTGVDHVLSAAFAGAPGAASVVIGENSLTASGIHEIEVI